MTDVFDYEFVVEWRVAKNDSKLGKSTQILGGANREFEDGSGSPLAELQPPLPTLLHPILTPHQQHAHDGVGSQTALTSGSNFQLKHFVGWQNKNTSTKNVFNLNVKCIYII